MKQRIMTVVGLDEGTAGRVLGTFPAGWIASVVNFVEAEGDVAATAVRQAIPFLLLGDTASAMIAVYRTVKHAQAKLPNGLKEIEVTEVNNPVVNQSALAEKAAAMGLTTDAFRPDVPAVWGEKKAEEPAAVPKGGKKK